MIQLKIISQSFPYWFYSSYEFPWQGLVHLFRVTATTLVKEPGVQWPHIVLTDILFYERFSF
jgi:hypothetical protein